MAVPATTWSNRTVAEDAAGKATRNNRAVAEGVVGKATVSSDRMAEKKLGRERGYFSSKSWYGYGRKRGPRVCSACYGACCGATRDFISRLVEADFLPPETQAAKVSDSALDSLLCCFRITTTRYAG